MSWQLLDISELDMVGAGREAKRRRKTLGAFPGRPAGVTAVEGGGGGRRGSLLSPPGGLSLVSRCLLSRRGQFSLRR